MRTPTDETDTLRVALENIEREATRESTHDPERDWQACGYCKIALLARRALAFCRNERAA